MSSAPNLGFDAFARDYDAQLNQGLRLSGETKEYFARERLRFTRSLIGEWAPGARVADFGCGTGTAAPFIREIFQSALIAGCDPSQESVAEARQAHEAPDVRFGHFAEVHAWGPYDLTYCNGVFHHILPAQRPAALRQIAELCRPGSWFALWENNPWNPMTRLIMSRVAFDRDAILLWPGEARRLLREAGFQVIATRYLFIFPTPLKALRFTEPWVSGLPTGGQYVVMARKA